MRHTLMLHGIVLGHSELEEVVPQDFRVWGQFHPGRGYELVEPIFRLFVEATPMPGGEPLDEIKLHQYYAARDRLALELLDEDGRVIPTSAIHIADYRAKKGPGAVSLDVLVNDQEYWKSRR